MRSINPSPTYSVHPSRLSAVSIRSSWYFVSLSLAVSLVTVSRSYYATLYTSNKAPKQTFLAYNFDTMQSNDYHYFTDPFHFHNDI